MSLGKLDTLINVQIHIIVHHICMYTCHCIVKSEQIYIFLNVSFSRSGS